MGMPPMWTLENRGRYDRSKLRYPGDLTEGDLLRHGVLPALLPGPPMMAMLYAIRWAFEPSALFPVGCAAFVGLTT